MRTLALATIASLLVLGCSGPRSASPNAAQERLGKAASRIYGGQPDTTHQAVVFVDLGDGNCSGTIIAACNGTGYVLTAAHCCETQVVQIIMGDDAYDFNAIGYNAIDTHPDPLYTGPSDDDFCMVQFDGADPGTPIIPAMTAPQDNLKAGDIVQFVGYGVTEFDENNTVRYQVSDNLDVVTSGELQYDQQPGGPCNGDSGGPSLSKVNGQEVVSGVTSQGDEGCVQYGESGRVSRVYDTFIKPYLGACAPPGTGSSSSSASSSSAEAASSSSASTGGGEVTSSGTGMGGPGAGTGNFTTGSSGDSGAGGGDPRDDSSGTTSGCSCESASTGPNAGAGMIAMLGITLLGARRRRRYWKA